LDVLDSAFCIPDSAFIETARLLFVLVLIVLFIAYGVLEYYFHRRRLLRIPIRVQVNGTRGKSSVTRLIAAGLRAGGLKVIAKTTGTTPRFITSDHEEVPVKRTGKANIIENVRLLIQASRYEPQAIVFECMALVPQYQWTDAHRVIQPTHGVITNARADHLDVMGPTVRDVALALSNTVPDRAQFFTAEHEFYPIFAHQAGKNHTQVHQARADAISDEDMKGFTYVEHKENVALALLVCQSILESLPANRQPPLARSSERWAVSGQRSAVLAGMYRTLPDPGVLRVYTIRDGAKTFELINTLAANDPDSIDMLWRMMSDRKPERIVMVNCRADRTERSRQLAEVCARYFKADYYVATGGLTGIFVRSAISLGLPKERVISMGDDWPPEKVYAGIRDLVRNDAMVFATGNIVGYGDSLIQYFASRGGEIAY
jgi:gamma-polyglutamate synthase